MRLVFRCRKQGARIQKYKVRLWEKVIGKMIENVMRIPCKIMGYFPVRAIVQFVGGVLAPTLR